MTSQRVVRGRKFCAKCGKWLHVREFRAVAQLSSGLNSWCRPCHRAATRVWRAENAVALNARRRTAYAANPQAEQARSRLRYALKVGRRVAQARLDLERAENRAA